VARVKGFVRGEAACTGAQAPCVPAAEVSAAPPACHAQEQRRVKRLATVTTVFCMRACQCSMRVCLHLSSVSPPWSSLSSGATAQILPS